MHFRRIARVRTNLISTRDQIATRTPRHSAGHNSYMEDYLKRKHCNLLLKITGTIILFFGWWALAGVTDHAWQQALIGSLFVFGAATFASGMEN